MKRVRGVFTALSIMAALLTAGMAGPAAAQDRGFACAPGVQLDADAAGKVALEDFSCFFGPYEGVQALHFRVALGNVSQSPQRFRVNIFLDNGKAVGGLLPQSTKKGLVPPGQSVSFVYPVTGMDTKPGEITLMIKTMAE